MQVTVTHRLNHLLNSLQKQNPSFLSQLQPPSVAYSLCKWGALILALLATYRTILIVRFRQNAPSIPLLIADHDYSDTDDDDDDGISSSPSTSEFEDDDDDEEDTTGEYFRVRGSSNGDGEFLRRRSIGDFLSLSEIANSKSVVKLWDTIGFGFDHSCSSSYGSVVSVYGANEEYGLRPFPTGKPPTTMVSCSSPAMVVSAGENESGNLAVRVWDTRLRRRIPAVIAEWGPSLGKIVGVDNGHSGLTVGDVRRVRSPLKYVTESNLDLWWPNSFILKI